MTSFFRKPIHSNIVLTPSRSNMSIVELKIFSVRFFGINVEHTEVSYGGVDYGFGRFGIYVTPSHIDKTVFGFTLERTINAGISNIPVELFHTFVRNSVHRFNRDTYSVWWRNCRHYSEYLLTELAASDSEIGNYYTLFFLVFKCNRLTHQCYKW